MGMEITRAVAAAGYKVIMACRDPEIAEEKRQLIMRETGNIALEIVPVNLASLSSTASFANELLQRGEVITLLMNNAGTMETRRCITEDGLERTVSVNYVVQLQSPCMKRIWLLHPEMLMLHVRSAEKAKELKEEIFNEKLHHYRKRKCI